MNKFLTLFERYGLIFVLFYCLGLLTSDFSQNTTLLDADLDIKIDSRSTENVFKQLFWITLFLLYVLSAVKTKMHIVILKHYKGLLLSVSIVILLCFASLLWSKYPGVTLKRSFFQLILIFVIGASAYFSVKRSSFSKCINIVTYVFFGASIFSIILGTGFDGNTFSAWESSKNNYGAAAFFLILMQALSHRFYPQPLIKYLRTNVALFGFLLLSISKTSIVLCVLFFLGKNLRQFESKILMRVIIASIAGIFVVPLLLSNLLGGSWSIASAIDLDALTGRGFIWSVAYKDLEENAKLLFGYGYGAYFNAGEIPDAFNIEFSFLQYINSAHNGFLELMLQLGTPITFLIIGLIARLASKTKDSLCYLIVGILFLFNITESAFLRDTHIVWCALLYVIFIGTFCSKPIGKLTNTSN